MVLLLGGGIALWMTKTKVEPPSSLASGEAEAVMTTKVEVFDGIWDPKRYSDELYYPIGIGWIDEKLVVADSMCDRIQIIGGEKNQRIGKPGQYGISYLDSGALLDGYREDALLAKPSDVALHPSGDIIICDTGNHVIRRMDAEYVVTIAGNGTGGYQNGREGQVQFNAPRSVAVDEEGVIYVSDTLNHCIRRIDPDETVSLYAGTPEQSGYQDGAAAQAQFYEPAGLYYNEEEKALYLADSANHAIRKLQNGQVTTVAGYPGEVNRQTGYPQGGYIDGPNEEARFRFPRDVVMLPDGSLVIADSMNHAVRLVDEESTRTLVGGGMADQYYGSAENLKLTRPEGVCTDGENVYVSDSLNHRILGIPLTPRILEGRPSREQMLANTGLTTNSSYSYKGDIRVYIGDQKVDMGRVPPWNTAECIYVPIRPLLEALGGTIVLNEKTNLLTVTVGEDHTVFALDQDYFILKGTAVTTLDEIIRLFPYTLEWFPEFSLLTLEIPSDLTR